MTLEEAIESEVDIHSTRQSVWKPEQRLRVADTDVGCRLKTRIEDLQALLRAYRSGLVKEQP